MTIQRIFPMKQNESTLQEFFIISLKIFSKLNPQDHLLKNRGKQLQLNRNYYLKLS